MARRAGLISVAAAVTACLAALVLAASARSFTIPDHFGLTINPGKQWGEWPLRRGKATISYATRSKALRTSLHAAVKAWNGSGAKVVFREVPWRRAKLRVYQRGRLSGKDDGYCGVAETPVRFNSDPRTGQLRSPGTITHGKVTIARRCGPENLTNDKIFERWIVAHELGHVLGLGHESRRCSIMGEGLPTRRRSPYNCREQTGKWFCGLISPDDAAGARWLYGGRRSNPTRYCFLYPQLARLPKRIKVSVSGSSSASYENPTSSESWNWSAQVTLVPRKVTNLPNRVYEVESGEISWSTHGTNDEYHLDPDAMNDPSKGENLDCSYAGTAQVHLQPGQDVLTFGSITGADPDPRRYEADAFQAIEVPVSGECAAGEFEGPRSLNGEVETPDWLVTGVQRGSIRSGLRGSSPVDLGDYISGDGSVSWEMVVPK